MPNRQYIIRNIYLLCKIEIEDLYSLSFVYIFFSWIKKETIPKLRDKTVYNFGNN